MPGFPVFYYLLEFIQTHVHWVGDANQPFSSFVVPFSLLMSNKYLSMNNNSIAY